MNYSVMLTVGTLFENEGLTDSSLVVLVQSLVLG